MIEITMLKNPASIHLPEIRAYQAVPGGADMFDFTEIDTIDLTELQARMENDNQARQAERRQLAIQKRIASLQADLIRLDKAVTRSQLAIKRKKADIANLRERITEGVAYAKTANVLERAISSKLRMEITLQGLRTRQQEITSELELLERQYI